MDLYQAIGKRVARLRAVRGLTQEQLAEAASLSAIYVGRIEAGAKRPTVRTLERLASALDAPLWRLVTDARLTTEEQAAGELERRLLAAVRDMEPADVSMLVALAERLRRRP